LNSLLRFNNGDLARFWRVRIDIVLDQYAPQPVDLFSQLTALVQQLPGVVVVVHDLLLGLCQRVLTLRVVWPHANLNQKTS
jgi:hypothetical protein